MKIYNLSDLLSLSSMEMLLDDAGDIMPVSKIGNVVSGSLTESADNLDGPVIGSGQSEDVHGCLVYLNLFAIGATESGSVGFIRLKRGHASFEKLFSVSSVVRKDSGFSFEQMNEEFLIYLAVHYGHIVKDSERFVKFSEDLRLGRIDLRKFYRYMRRVVEPDYEMPDHKGEDDDFLVFVPSGLAKYGHERFSIPYHKVAIRKLVTERWPLLDRVHDGFEIDVCRCSLNYRANVSFIYGVPEYLPVAHPDSAKREIVSDAEPVKPRSESKNSVNAVKSDGGNGDVFPDDPLAGMTGNDPVDEVSSIESSDDGVDEPVVSEDELKFAKEALLKRASTIDRAYENARGRAYIHDVPARPSSSSRRHGGVSSVRRRFVRRPAGGVTDGLVGRFFLRCTKMPYLVSPMFSVDIADSFRSLDFEFFQIDGDAGYDVLDYCRENGLCELVRGYVGLLFRCFEHGSSAVLKGHGVVEAVYESEVLNLLEMLQKHIRNNGFSFDHSATTFEFCLNIESYIKFVLNELRGRGVPDDELNEISEFLQFHCSGRVEEWV